jgi:cyclohexanecarboxylate-CoA ligase
MRPAPNWIPREAQSLWDLVELRVEQSPDDRMLFDEHDRVLTFAQFRTAVERCAAGLIALGIDEGTAVSWQLPTRIETVVLSTALSRIGAVQNPIIPIYGRREVTAVLEQTGAEWLFVLTEQFPVECKTVAIDARLGEPGFPDGDPATVPPPPAAAPADDAPVRWVYTTSGTTSLPKGVRHTDRTLLAGGTGLALALEPSTDDVALFAVPFAHIAGPDFLVMMLTTELPTMVMETFVPAQVVEQMNRHRVTLTGGATAIYQAFLAVQRAMPETPIVPSLRMLMGGGGPKPPEIFWEVLREMGARIVHGYGMTECPMITMGSPHDSDEELANTDGQPVRGCEVRVVLEDGTLAPSGTEGELRVRGPMLFRGYTDPEQTAAAFDDDGFFRTGDLGVIRDDGHVCVTGRLKDVIIRKGENIGAQEVESALYEHPRVAAVAVIGLPDRERGERVCAVVETVAGAEPITFLEMQEHCREIGLSQRKWPEQLEIVDALPRNATMKVLKYELKERFS